MSWIATCCLRYLSQFSIDVRYQTFIRATSDHRIIDLKLKGILTGIKFNPHILQMRN